MSCAACCSLVLNVGTFGSVSLCSCAQLTKSAVYSENRIYTK